MKHIFIAETADGVYLSPRDIDELTLKLEGLVKTCIEDHGVFVQSICNQKSVIRGVYAVYGADVRKSPEALESEK